MGRYPKLWMNLVSTGVRVAALGSVGIGVLYFIIVYKMTKIPEGADGMLPNFQPGRGILANSRPGALSRGDVVIYKAAHSTNLIGRIAGLPEEKVSLAGGRLHINGELAEDYTYNVLVTGDSLPPEAPPYAVSAGHVFVLNDNLASGTPDSRSLGQVAAASILGVVVMTF